MIGERSLLYTSHVCLVIGLLVLSNVFIVNSITKLDDSICDLYVLNSEGTIMIEFIPNPKVIV